MKNNKKKEQAYKSMREFDEKFFPESLRKQLLERTTDARTLGINLAKESLEIIRSRLSK